jgi:hypothetical protein
MAKGLKLKQKNISDAKKKLKELILKVLKTHPRSTPTREGKRTITERSGNLFKEIYPDFKIEKDKLVMEVKMMEYFEWLDGGTSKMDGWFFSEEIMDSKELEQISEDLLFDLVEGKILDMISDIKK